MFEGLKYIARSKTLNSVLVGGLKRTKSSSSIRIERTRVRKTLETSLDTYLKSPGDIYVFEVDNSILDTIIAVIDQPPLSLKYSIIQLEEEGGRLFQAQLKVLDL